MTQETQIRISADTRPAEAQLRALNRLIATTGTGGFGPASAALQQLNGNMSIATGAAARMSAGITGAGASAQRASGGFMGLAGAIGSLSAIMATLGFAALGGGVLSATAKVESLKASLATVTGSAAAAGAEFDRLAKFAAKTPFSLEQSVSGFTKLVALGLNPSEAAMKSYGNTASAMGKDLNQMIEAVADASTGEFERLKEFGIKAKSEGDKVSFTFQGVTTTIGKNAAEIEGYLQKIGEKNFAGAMELQAATLGGAFSNLKDTVFLAFAAIGEGDLSKSISAVINGVSQTIANSLPALRQFGADMAGVISSVANVAGPVFGLLIGNLGTMIGLVKVAAASWLAFKAAGAVSTVLAMTKQVIALNMALGATGPVSALFAAGMKAVQGAIRGVTAALLANPFTALAVAITGIIALLYEFSDKIKIGGGSIASLSSLVKSFAESVGPLFSAIGDTVSTVFTAIGDIASSVFGGLLDTIKPFFKGFDFSIAGMLRFAAKVLDGLVTVFNFALAAIKQSFNTLPQFLGFVFATAFNGATSMIEKFANGAISAINLLISAANAMGASFDKIDPVKLERMAATMPKIKGGGELWAGAQSSAASAYVEGRIARAGAIEGAGAKERTSAGFNPPSPTGKPTGAANDNDAGKKVADAQKKLEEIQAKYDEFFLSLSEQTKLAAMLPAEAERYNKELELRKILGDGELKNARELSDLEKQKIDSALKGKALAEITRDMKIAERDLAFEKSRLEEQAAIIASGTTEQVAEKLALEEKLAKFKKAAMEAGIPLEDAAFQKALATLSVRERENIALAKRNELIKAGLDDTSYAKDAIRTDGTDEQRRAAALNDRNIREEQLKAQLEAGRITIGEYDAGMRRVHREHSEAMRAIAGEFYDQMTDGVYRLANLFEGKMGEVFGALGRVIEKLKQIDPEGKIGGALKGLFGEKFMKDIGAAFGKALDGAELGGEIANLAHAIGIKGFNKTGAQIGGAIGSFIPIPGGQIIGSVIGGIIGSIFAKAPRAAAVIESGNVSVTGNKAAQRDAVSTSANSITSALSSIAESLGGALGTYAVSIGKYKDHFRVSGIATSRVGEKHPNTPLLYNGTDEAEAIRIAIQNAIADGAITGISDFAQKALRALDVDQAIALAGQFTEITKALDAMADPIGFAVKEINTSLDALVKKMVAVGASSEDLAKVEDYRSKKLAEAYKSGIDTLSKFKDALNGQGTGVTDLTRLNTALGKFEAFKADIAAGKQIDQSAFTAIGSEIMGLASSVYGTSTGAFQDIRAMLTEATQGAIDTYQQSYDDAMAAAIEAQTNAITNQQAITNDLLRQQNDLLERMQNGGGSGTSDLVNSIMGNQRANYY